MKPLRQILIPVALLFIPSGQGVFSWGFWAHTKINRMAVFTLPPEMISFYKTYIDYIGDHAPDPDRRRNMVPEEAPRHYFDSEHYNAAFDSVPHSWKDAVAKYGEDSLNAYGIVPWHIVKMTYALTNAFMEKDVYRILRCSADLGHYIADAHVPLHTTENYNGQLTSQEGIHNFWESRLPELFGERYDCFTGRASYINDLNEESWRIIQESYAAVDSVLGIEKKLTESFPADKKFSFEAQGSVTKKVYSKKFSEKYHEMLNGMVERRLRLSIKRVGDFWYTAWINAGSPRLDIISRDEGSKQLADSSNMADYPLPALKLKARGHIDE